MIKPCLTTIGWLIGLERNMALSSSFKIKYAKYANDLSQQLGGSRYQREI
jgi:hypothetical protein